MANPTADLALAGVLRRLRWERGLDAREVAFRAGITEESYTRVERGQTVPSWITVRSICLALGVTLRELADAVEASTATGPQTPAGG